MKKPKILQILSMYHPEGEKILAEAADVIRTDDIDPASLSLLAAEADGIVLRAPARITKEIIDAAPHLKAITGAGVGLDNIDVAYATSKGIPVLHAPSVNAVSTAEHAVMMIMALAKGVIPMHQAMSKGNYQARTMLNSYELKGKKAGIIGFGSIGKEAARILGIGLGMDVAVWVRKFDPAKHGAARELGIKVTEEIYTIFSEADFISLHIPLTAETRGLVDGRLLSRMKPSSYLINTARGAIVNQKALFEMLKAGKIAGAALDVFDPEPPAENDPILTLPNIIVTPHVGGTTVECNYIMSTTIAHNILKALRGEKPQFIGNPEVYNK